MRSPRSIMLLAASGILAALVAVAALPGVAPANALSNCNAPPDTNAAAEAQMLNLMNQARSAAGLVSLTTSVSLQRAALWKSDDSSAYGPGFSHIDSLGRDTVMSPPNNRAMDCGYPTWAAEDLAWGFPDANSAFNAWMNSPDHRANILDPNARVVGIGFVMNNGVPCWTADFGAVQDPAGSASLQLQPNSTPASGGVASASANVVPLSKGINLIVFVGPTEDIAAALGSLGDNLSAAYAWNAATQSWDAYFPGAPAYAQDLQTMTAGSAYYLIMRTGATWTY